LKLLKGTYKNDRPLDEVEMDAGMGEENFKRLLYLHRYSI